MTTRGYNLAVWIYRKKPVAIPIISFRCLFQAFSTKGPISMQQILKHTEHTDIPTATRWWHFFKVRDKRSLQTVEGQKQRLKSSDALEGIGGAPPHPPTLHPFLHHSQWKGTAFLFEPSGIVILWFNEIYRQIFFFLHTPRQHWNEFSTSHKKEREKEREYGNKITKSVGVSEGSQRNTLVFSGRTKILNYHQTRNESKESNFHQIIKPLSFMTPSWRKLLSLCMCPSVGC